MRETESDSIGFAGALFLLFLVLKLAKVIDWSWWWILAPVWMPAAVFSAIAAVYVAWNWNKE